MGRRFTLSGVAHELFEELTLLPHYAHDDCVESVQIAIGRLQKLLAIGCPAMRESGHLFATAGAVSDVVTVGGRHYASAHDAAFKATTSFMDRFWFHLDPEGYKQNSRLALSSPRNEETDNALQVMTDSTGLDLKRIVDDWPRAKAGIIELLTEDWQKEFSSVDARIMRERAAVKSSAPKETAADTSRQSETPTIAVSSIELSSGAQNETVRAHDTKLFPKGVPDDADLRDVIVKLNSERSPQNNDIDICRKFFGESVGNDPKSKSMQGKIRALRSRGGTTLPKRT